MDLLETPTEEEKKKKLEEMYERRRFERRKWPGWNNFFVSVPPEVAPIAKPIGISVQDVSYINTHKHTNIPTDRNKRRSILTRTC